MATTLPQSLLRGCTHAIAAPRSQRHCHGGSQVAPRWSAPQVCLQAAAYESGDSVDVEAVSVPAVTSGVIIPAAASNLSTPAASGGVSTLEPPPPPPEPRTPPSSGGGFEVTVEDIKAALLDSLYGTDRGISARSELRAEISELISQLEAKNPTPNPTETIEQLDGEWRLVYTSNSALLAVLALGKLPLVTVGDMVQRIDSASMTVENKVTLSGPLSKTELSTTAAYEVRSPKRLQLKLSNGKVSTPELTGDLDLPSSVTVLGQFIDLSQLKDAVAPFKDQASGLIAQLNSLVGQVPELNVPIQSDDAQTWQLTTYVDGDLRISRGDRGATFIYSRIPAPVEPQE